MGPLLGRSLPFSLVRVTVAVLLLQAVGLVAGHGSHTEWSFLEQFSGPIETTAELWVYSIASTLLISAAPFVILFFIPIENASEHSTLLKVLLSFASGGLLGDAFLHLIPHAISPHGHKHDHHHDEHDHHHDEHDHHHHDKHDHHHDEHDHMADMMVGGWVLLGIVAFLIVEKFVRLARGGEGHSHGGHAHSHGNRTEPKVTESKNERGDSSTVRKRKGGKGNTTLGALVQMLCKCVPWETGSSINLRVSPFYCCCKALCIIAPTLKFCSLPRDICT